jgi:signal peptidase
MDARIGLLVAVLAVVGVASTGVLPVQFSYVTSDSMEPTLSPGDGYVLVEGSAEVGDVATFSTPDGYVTHRIVGAGPNGYTTRGDANPSTDQAAGMPPVEEGQVLGHALTLGSHVLVIPGLGALAGFVAAYRPLLLVGLVGLVTLAALPEHSAGVPNRELLRISDVVLPLSLGLAAACVLTLVVSVTTEHLTFVATTVDGGTTLAVGESAVRTVQVDIVGAPFTQTVVDANGVTVVDRTVSGSAATLDVRVPAQSNPGAYTASVSVHPYPAVIPRGVVLWLHAIHPMVASVVSTAAVFTPVWAVYGLLLDGRAPLRLTSRDGGASL